MYAIDTTITIKSSPEAVWAVLMDFEKYGEWNPFILWAEGDPAVGNTIKAHIHPPGGKGMTHQPTVQIAKPGRHLQWLGKVAIPGMLAACHDFILKPDGAGTELRHREEFSGVLVHFIKKTLKQTEEGFDAHNRALKERVEMLEH